jgi:hypothetical protein
MLSISIILQNTSSQKGIWEKDNKVRKNRAIKKSATVIKHPRKQGTTETQKQQNNSITGGNKNKKKLSSNTGNGKSIKKLPLSNKKWTEAASILLFAL